MAILPAAAITRQIGSRDRARLSGQEAGELQDAARCLVVDRDGQRIPFGALFRDHRAIVVFVRHFLCYTCKEYVEDLAKIPKNLLQEAKVRLIVIGQSSHYHIKPFCSLTGYPHEIYVDPEREIYKILGMKKGEAATTSVQSPHVKSNLLSGSIRSIWRAMTGPAFDFQGDPAQQGGTLILGPGSKVHFVHLDKNRLDHAPISTVLQLAGVKMGKAQMQSSASTSYAVKFPTTGEISEISTPGLQRMRLTLGKPPHDHGIFCQSERQTFELHRALHQVWERYEECQT